MKTAIIYDTKSGTCEKCAYLLKERLAQCDVFNMKNKRIPIEEYDLIIIGSYVRMGRFSKRAARFMIKNMSALENKDVALFVCCGNTDGVEERYSLYFPYELLNKAVAVECFGGEINFSFLRGIDRFIMGAAANVKEEDKAPLPSLLPERIDAFCEKLKEI